MSPLVTEENKLPPCPRCRVNHNVVRQDPELFGVEPSGLLVCHPYSFGCGRVFREEKGREQ